MKFRATVEVAGREHEFDFDIDDDAVAQARLTEAIARIQKKFLKQPERPAKSSDTTRPTSTTPASPTAGGGK